MNSRKYLLMVLIFALALQFEGCSLKPRTEVSNYSNNETSASTEKSNSVKAAVNLEPVDISDIEGSKTWQTIRYPVITCNNNKKLQDSLDELNEEMKKAAEDFKRENKDAVREFIKEHPEMQEAEYIHTSDILIVKNDEKYLSFTEYVYEFTMGAHGNYVQNGHTYDVKTGKKLKLDDFINSREELRTYLKNWVRENKDSVGLFDEAESTIDDYIDEKYELQFYLSDGVIITFQPYDVAPYAAGLIELKLDDKLLKVKTNDI